MHSPGRALREMLLDDNFALIMEAHNALVARICERNGFRALWASSLTLSSSMGLRDCNEATWTELLMLAEWIVAASKLPVLFDGDSGQGNFNNVRRLVRTLCDRRFAGVVIEDKRFPKMNSFVGNDHTLAPVDEFQGKIRAAKDAQTDRDFMIITRLEGFIASEELPAIMERAHAYHLAGADALFVHSRQPHSREIKAFMGQWDRSLPVIVAPTTYSNVSFTDLKDLGIAGAICANHALRAAVRAIDDVTRSIRECNSLSQAEKKIAPLSELFDLLNYCELLDAAKKYGVSEMAEKVSRP